MKKLEKEKLDKIREGFVGSLLGGAIGDALGKGYEFAQSASISKEEVMDKIKLSKFLSYTDDTVMMIGLTESLIENKGLKQDKLAYKFLQNFIKEPYRGYGIGTIEFFNLVMNGYHWKEASKIVFKEGSFGNGGAMRIAPIALLYFDEGKEVLRSIAYKATEVTHSHPLGLEGSALLALSISIVLKGRIEKRFDANKLLREALRFTKYKEYRQKVEKIKELLNSNASLKLVASELGNLSTAQDSVPSAIYCFLSTNKFEECVIKAIMLGGDTDTIACMSGYLAGAYYGESKLPKYLLSKLENKDKIKNLALKLFEVWKAKPSTNQMK